MNIKCEPRVARAVPGLEAAQRHFHQGAGAVDFMHGGEGQDLTWRFGVQQHGLLADSQGTDEVFGELDQKVLVAMLRSGTVQFCKGLQWYPRGKTTAFDMLLIREFSGAQRPAQRFRSLHHDSIHELTATLFHRFCLLIAIREAASQRIA